MRPGKKCHTLSQKMRPEKKFRTIFYFAEPLPHIKTSETIDTRQKQDRGKMDFEIPSIKGAESRNEEAEKTPETIPVTKEEYIDEGNKSQQVQTQIRFAQKLLGTETENFKQPVKELEVETREEIPYPESEDETREEISDPIYSAEPLPHIKTSETIDTRQKEDQGKMDFEIPSIKGAESRNEEAEKTPETLAVIQKQSECSEKSGKERIASFYDNKITVKFYNWLQRMPLQMTSVNARQHANQALHVWRYMTEKLTIQGLFEKTALNGWVGEALKTFQPGTVVSYIGSVNRLVTFLLDAEQIPQQEEPRARRLMDHIFLTRKMPGKKVKLRRTVIETEECGKLKIHTFKNL
ncbi:unnamed protein product [Mytilus coruscus]|uniref:Uncharacterized protein n=1 Tax=Mytilus coruscus TaxID=42192 RepID=A0A6J8BYA4_MYTCO|nr:unnamed protein product [Mytilus coruscus]